MDTIRESVSGDKARLVLGTPILSWLMLFGLVVMWGSSFGLTKVAIASIPVETIVAARLAIAGIVLVAVLWITGRRLPTDRRLWALFFVMAILGNCLPFTLTSWGQTRVGSGLAGMLIAITPIVTLLLSHFLVAGETITRMKLLGFILGFMGVAVLIGPEAILHVGGAGSALVAQLAIVIAAMCYAANTVIARLCSVRDAVVVAVATTLAANLIFAPFVMSSSISDPTGWSFSSLIAVVTLGVVSTGLAPLVFFRLIHDAGPTFVSLISYLVPLWATGIGVLFFDEVPSWSALLALIVILAGIAISQTPKEVDMKGNRLPSETESVDFAHRANPVIIRDSTIVRSGNEANASTTRNAA
tara:strand:+ start:2975 stop:4048 length:1074 start_codon:yes stop_codon:yes gene_type:complete